MGTHAALDQVTQDQGQRDRTKSSSRSDSMSTPCSTTVMDLSAFVAKKLLRV